MEKLMQWLYFEMIDYYVEKVGPFDTVVVPAAYDDRLYNKQIHEKLSAYTDNHPGFIFDLQWDSFRVWKYNERKAYRYGNN